MEKRATLKQVLKTRDLFFLAFGIYAGVGWVVTLPLWLQHGPLAAVLGFLFCGVILIPVGMCYAEIVPAMPLAGGELTYAYKAFGRFAGTITGWFLALAYIIVSPFEAIAVATVLSYMFPGINVIPLYELLGFTLFLPPLVIGIVFSLAITALNYFGVRPSSIFQTVVSAVVLVIVALFLVMGIAGGEPANLQPLFAGPGVAGALAGILAVVAIAPFFLAGFDAIPQVVEEAETGIPRRKLGTVIIAAIFGGIAFYIVTTLAASLSAPWQETIGYELPTAYALGAAFGDLVKNICLVAAFLGILTTWNGVFLAGSRVLFAMGRGRLIPSFFGEVHGRYGTPHKTIVIVGIITVLGPFLGTGGLGPIVNVGAVGFLVAWLSICLSVYRLRDTAPGLKREYLIPGGKATALLGAVICFFLLSMFLPGMPVALAWPVEFMVLAAWITFGILMYFTITRKESAGITREQQAYLVMGEYADK